MKKGNSQRKNDIVFIMFSLVLGLLMGWLSGDFMGKGFAGALICNNGIWIFISALLALFSSSPMRGFLHGLIYFAGVIAAYGLHVIAFGGSVSTHTLTEWLIFGVIGSVICFIDWHAGEREWLGAACSAVPISILIAEGYPVYQTKSTVLMLDIAFALALYIIMDTGKNKKLMALPFIIVFVFALVYFDVLTKLTGGLL